MISMVRGKLSVFKFGKKAAAIVLASVVAVGGGVAAYAYWSGGFGTGSATVDSGSLELAAHFDLAGVSPGHDTSITYTATNNGDTGASVSWLSQTVEVTPAAGQICPAGSFTIDDTTTWEPFLVQPGQQDVEIKYASWTEDPLRGYLHFVNLPTTNQDGCKGATVTVNVSIAG
jgi:hypothetical protein